MRWHLSLVVLVLMMNASAFAHDGYENLRSNQGYSCCSDTDCHPIRAQQDQDGNWLVFITETQTWTPVPVDAVLNQRMPDGRCHACYKFQKFFALAFYCFIPCDVRS